MKKTFPPLLGHNIKVPVYSGDHLQYINLDNAATTPPFLQVSKKLNEIMPYYGSIHRGSGYKSLISTQLFEEAKDTIFKFADGDIENDIIIFGVNATDCINHLSRRLNLGKDEVIIVSESEHTSNILPWRKNYNVIECKSCDDGVFDLNHLESLLKIHKVRLITVTGASNVTGKITNTKPIAYLGHKYGSEICVDASQLAGHRKLNRGKHGSPNHIDYIIFSAHKMYAPFGVGVLVGNNKIFKEGWPDMVGGGTVSWMDDQNIIWSELPYRESGGTPNYFGIIALAEACKLLDLIGYENIIAHEKILIKQAKKSFQQIKGFQIVHPFNEQFENVLPLFSFHINGISPGMIGAYLGFEKAIGVRTGMLCQYKLIKKILNLNDLDCTTFKHMNPNISSNIMNIGLTRASCGLGNNPNDLMKLANALCQLTEHGTEAIYSFDLKGYCQPDNYLTILPDI